MSDKESIPFGRPLITDDDRKAVLDVLDGPILTHGPRCHDFETSFAAFMQGGNSVTTSSCTAAMHLYYMYLGIGIGDEVIVPALSHVATAHSVEITGATPKFVDVTADTGTLDPQLIEAALTSATKAISVVHFNGMPTNMTAVMEIASKHGLPVLEDCATALGATWGGTHVGMFGDGAAFSFYPAKHITSAEGGMFTSRRHKVADKIRRLRGFCYDRSLNERKLPGIYDVNGLGLNYRMSELQAALGASQLSRFAAMLEIRDVNAAAYADALKDVADVRILKSTDGRARDSHYCLTVMLDGPLAGARDNILARLTEEGIGVSVHYPHPLPRLSYYKDKYGYNAAHFATAECIADRSFNLPVAPHIDRAARERIVETFIKIAKELHK